MRLGERGNRSGASVRDLLVALRPIVWRLHRYLMNHVGHELDESQLRRPTVVFSPHFDDETLACGGTIALKRAAGAPVTIVFMTDGGKSHHRLISEAILRKLRAEEGIAAARALGVDASDVILLDFEETRLADHVEEGVERVLDILAQRTPLDIFVPYHREPPSDHIATNRIVCQAARSATVPVVIYEYPIWFWQHWPWASSAFLRSRGLRSIVEDTITIGLRLMRDFWWRVDVSGVLHIKRTALEQHRTQMTRLNSNPAWATLHDVWGGGFLETLMQDHEVFLRHKPISRNPRRARRLRTSASAAMQAERRGHGGAQEN